MSVPQFGWFFLANMEKKGIRRKKKECLLSELNPVFIFVLMPIGWIGGTKWRINHSIVGIINFFGRC